MVLNVSSRRIEIRSDFVSCVAVRWPGRSLWFPDFLWQVGQLTIGIVAGGSHDELSCVVSVIAGETGQQGFPPAT